MSAGGFEHRTHAQQFAGSSAERRGRWLQLTLAAFWALDALLQLQPANFGKQLVFGTILGNAENQPQPIYGSLVLASHLLGPYAFELNVAIIAVQLSIAAGLLWTRTAKQALGLSIVWALGIWWLGEGFGGLFAGKATLLVGAPGPALLYALLALVAWPDTQRGPGASAAAQHEAGTTAAGGALGEPVTRSVWALLWIGGAILRVIPFWFPPVYALAGDLQLDLNQEPPWIFQLNQRLSQLASTAGLVLVIALAVIEAAIGLGVLTRYRRASLAAGIVVATIYWTIGQQFAQLFTGDATDVAAGPLYVVLALTLWPRKRNPATRPQNPSVPIEASGAALESLKLGLHRLRIAVRSPGARKPQATLAARPRLPAHPGRARISILPIQVTAHFSAAASRSPRVSGTNE